MSTKFEFRFDDNGSGVYYPGQQFTGHVDMTVVEPTKVKSISLHIKGAADVCWTENLGGDGTSVIIRHTGRQAYFNTVTYLVGSEDGLDHEILPGTHTYPFSCILPAHIPTSFEGKHGHIRYTAKVVMNRPWKSSSTYKVAFTVLRQLNLNDLDLSTRLPAKLDVNKVFFCGPCASAPLHISSQVPITGYVPGQTIAVQTEVYNQSKKTVLEFVTKLIKIASFTSQRPYRKTKVSTETIAEVHHPGVGATGRETFVQHLTIPSISPTNNTCDILAVVYAVMVEAKIPGINLNPKLKIPITIGTYPLTSSAIPSYEPRPKFSVTQPQNLPMIGGRRSLAPLPAFDEVLSMDHLPPPTYEEAVDVAPANILDKEEQGTESSTYKPHYMVYHFSH